MYKSISFYFFLLLHMTAAIGGSSHVILRSAIFAVICAQTKMIPVTFWILCMKWALLLLLQ
jgi:hypothetical protein